MFRVWIIPEDEHGDCVMPGTLMETEKVDSRFVKNLWLELVWQAVHYGRSASAIVGKRVFYVGTFQDDENLVIVCYLDGHFMREFVWR